MPIRSEGNTIYIVGDLLAPDWHRVLAAMHNVTQVRLYRDIVLDFSDCTKAFAPEMVGLSAQCQAYWKAGIDISLKSPKDEKLARLFKNANWAHLIDFRGHDESRYRGVTQVPTLRFSSAKEQYEAVNKAIDLLLSAISHFKREDLRAMEWAINEITDNVLTHSQSKIGGLVQVTNMRSSAQVEFVVSDPGVGVPGSLRPTHPDLRSDEEALNAAIREGVTRDKSIGQGNGLYGSWQIAAKSGGSFHLTSGYATLKSSEKYGVKSQINDIPFSGSVVAFRIGYGEKVDLRDALVFKGVVHTPTDYVETHFEVDTGGAPVFNVGAETNGYGSRSAGDATRKKLANILKFSDVGRVVVDMADVVLVSSSFADEVFGKLFAELGPLQFSSRLEFVNIDPLVRALIDKAILQRVRQ